jgi:hypothetical protein
VGDASIEDSVSELHFQTGQRPRKREDPMLRIRYGRLAVAGLTVALTLTLGTRARAQTKKTQTPDAQARAEFSAISQQILKSKRISLGTASKPGVSAAVAVNGSANGFLQLKQVLHKATAQRVQAVQLSTNQSSTSSIIQVGSAAVGLGVEFDWDRSQQACLVGMAINASDTLGVAIGGLKAGDKVEVLRATGICTFDKDTGHPLLASLIGLLGEGTQDAIDAFVGTEFDNVIKSATTDLQNAAKGSGKGTMQRDPYGIVPGSNSYGLDEGGLVVMMPQAGGIYYSGGGHSPASASLPHVFGQARGLPADLAPYANIIPLYFLGHSVPNGGAVCQNDGVAYVLAWDWAYGDNAGTYQVVVRLTRGNGSASPPPSTPAVVRKARTKG